jgi:hypothetical protein
VNNPDRVDELVAELTLGEKCAMVSGSDAWSIPGCERLGIPAWRVSDGPVGVRGRAMIPSLLLPSPSAMAATWDMDLLEALGRALGHECVDRCRPAARTDGEPAPLSPSRSSLRIVQ